MPQSEMSIISEALKKAQKERAKRHDREKSAEDSTDKLFQEATFTIQRVPDERSTGSKVFLVIVSLVIILALAGGSFFYFSRPSSGEKPLVAPARPEKKAAVAPPVVPKVEEKTPVAPIVPTPAENNVTMDTFKKLPTLNGIMYSENQPQAIINGVMVSEGEDVDGFSVLKIYPEKVTLSSGDNDFELKLR